MRHALMYVLGAIIVLNVLAIAILSQRLDQPPVEERLQQAMETPPPNTKYVLPKPEVQVLVLSAPDCPDCYDVTRYVEELDDVMNLTVSAGDPRAFRTAVLLQPVPDADRLPALAFNRTIEEYPTMIDGWEAAGYVIRLPDRSEYAGVWYVLPTLNAPYYNATDGRVHGRVSVTYLTMASCEECYGTDVLRQNLADVRITPWREETVDISSPEGARIVRQYNITAVPTLLMDEGADHYRLRPGWDLVGTVENGTYVLRDLQRLQVVYYDLAQDRLMEP